MMAGTQRNCLSAYHLDVSMGYMATERGTSEAINRHPDADRSVNWSSFPVLMPIWKSPMSNRIVEEKRIENRWILPIAVKPIDPAPVRNMNVATTEMSMIVKVMNNGGNSRRSISFLDVSGRYNDGTIPTNDRMI
jgi:hypothetical protein